MVDVFKGFFSFFGFDLEEADFVAFFAAGLASVADLVLAAFLVAVRVAVVFFAAVRALVVLRDAEDLAEAVLPLFGVTDSSAVCDADVFEEVAFVMAVPFAGTPESRAF
ncbi:hypothetical protein [Parvularcula sp. LCG005]|uniref:hypothetical protein n=1 Tax=Parvularcula sp. LCG005 TaxID=3078805 RepID=UPI002942D7A3|nr:hypothetical protein [Parvularcula sp. LCG005]WOI52252.1 hypothetical protein RUI03_08815 [Parvularcula sp. LCG005]